MDQLPQRAPDLDPGGGVGAGEDEALVGGRYGLDSGRFQGQALRQRTTRVPARRSCSALPPSAIMRNPIPKRAPERI